MFVRIVLFLVVLLILLKKNEAVEDKATVFMLLLS